MRRIDCIGTVLVAFHLTTSMMTTIFIHRLLKICYIVNLDTMSITGFFKLFEINHDIDTLLNEIYPDFQFYSDVRHLFNTKCDYYIEDTFNEKITKEYKTKMGCLFHINVKSLPKHFDDLELYIDSLDFRFSIIGVTETWLDKCKYKMYNICNYDSVHRYRSGKEGGGVSVI